MAAKRFVPNNNVSWTNHGSDDSLNGKCGIRVVARGDLAHSDTVAKIPKSIVLSKRTSQLPISFLNSNIAWDDMMELTLVLAFETLIGEKSKWFGYLQSLPSEQVPVAALWEGNDDSDSQMAFLWIQGTETEKVINPFGFSRSISQNIFKYFNEVASPILATIGYQTTILNFRRAWSLVSSRSFRVDTYHGLAMVPIADAFNHTTENQVHMETDFDVCPVCGALQSCPHDEEDEAPLGPGPTENAPPPLEDTCDMVINAPVQAGDEVFNTYDANLPNSVLLARYGFIIEGNEFDYIGWEPASLPHNLQICTTARWDELARVWTSDLLDETSLVCDPTELSATLSSHASSDTHGGNTPRTPQYKLNSDGLVSVDLWVLAAICALKATDASCLDTVLRSRLEQLAAIQVHVENGELINPGIPQVLQLRLIANLIQDMCRSRLLGMYKPELSVAECGNLLDDLPDDMFCSRLAICQALSERATLSACIDGWHSLVGSIDELGFSKDVVLMDSLGLGFEVEASGSVKWSPPLFFTLTAKGNEM
ncbi:SET domain protein [Ceratobasidium sp. AG-Ba]|nr:SET domain protein [Ceratobasidium sp. AG-Ba]